MDDKKIKNNPNQPEIDELLKNAKENKSEFGANQSDDINKNLGSFTNTVKKAEPSATTQIKLDVDQKVIEKASKEQVDFEHFGKSKRHERKSKSKFGEKVGLMLRSKKGLTITWIVELVIMSVIIVLASLLIAYLNIKMKDGKFIPILSFDNSMKCAKVARVFLWISIFPCAVPLIYLVTAWFVGINQVASSKIFHYMFWICLIICLVCFIVGIGCAIKPIDHILEIA